MVGTLVGDVGVHHGVTFNFGFAKVCSPALFEISFPYDKDIWIAATDYYMDSFIIFSVLINAVILLLNCLVLILYLYIHFLSLIHYFLYLNIIWSFIQLTLLLKYPDLCTVSLLLYLMVLKTISPGCGVRASLMLFYIFPSSLIKRPARDACLCMGDLQAPPAPHFVFLITL